MPDGVPMIIVGFIGKLLDLNDRELSGLCGTERSAFGTSVAPTVARGLMIAVMPYS